MEGWGRKAAGTFVLVAAVTKSPDCWLIARQEAGILCIFSVVTGVSIITESEEDP